ncbi:hypothetical protein GQ44DRAFT_687868 [Phaeosphaeriaceae sp. PMI808]|nr:hypothetical protein GQ44DRAFT_687868 [Phaeosphaeriaceae sp. PMI808]
MGHIIEVSPGYHLGPLFNRLSLAQYTVAVVIVALRFITRACLVKKLGLDDLFIAVAVVLGGVQTETIILQVQYGRGRHTKGMHVEEFNQMLKYTWINMLVYFVANWAVKMSILALYHRIGFKRQGLPWIVQAPAIWITAGIMTAFTVASFLAQLLACIPISRIWDVQRQPEGCIDGTLFMQASAAINVGADVILLLFPLPLLPLMKFNKKQQTALGIIFSVGIIPVIASTMRLCEIAMAGSPVSIDMSWQKGDSSWMWAWVPIWSQIEVDVGIFAASLPSLHPLVNHVWKGFSTCGPPKPPHLPDFVDYHESWKTGRLSDNDEFLGDEKPKGSGTSFYNDASDSEDEIDETKMANARIAGKSVTGKVRMVTI